MVVIIAKIEKIASKNTLGIKFQEKLPKSKNKSNYLKECEPTKELENFIEKQKNSSIELWITAETAVDFYLEENNFLSKLYSILPKNQTWIIGAKKKELGGNQFFYYNSAYFLKGKDFTNRHYKKELLVPFAEYIPHWAKFLKIGPLVNLGNIYQAASPKTTILCCNGEIKILR